MDRGFKSANKYIVGPVERFDEKNTMVMRVEWDPEVQHLYHKLRGVAQPKEKKGHTLKDRALQNASWYLSRGFGSGNQSGGLGLYAWESRPSSSTSPLPPGLKMDISDPAIASRQIKKVASFFGACQVGICELDIRWVYSHSFQQGTQKHEPLELPPEYKYAVVMAIEMDYNAMRSAPTCVGGAATGLGYSKMAFTAGLLAFFIRELGFKAISCGNDTTLSIPLAIDAGLGEMGRNGLIITRDFGPRVRLCKVLTDMPLEPDVPVEFGVAKFCEKCIRCARQCPGQAIQPGARTDKPLSRSNNGGVLKWPVDGEKCYKFWAANGASCSMCVRVCPFNKPRGKFHDFVRYGVKHAPWANRLFIWGDSLLAYGKHASPNLFWEE